MSCPRQRSNPGSEGQEVSQQLRLWHSGRPPNTGETSLLRKADIQSKSNQSAFYRMQNSYQRKRQKTSSRRDSVKRPRTGAKVLSKISSQAQCWHLAARAVKIPYFFLWTLDMSITALPQVWWVSPKPVLCVFIQNETAFKNTAMSSLRDAWLWGVNVCSMCKDCVGVSQQSLGADLTCASRSLTPKRVQCSWLIIRHPTTSCLAHLES